MCDKFGVAENFFTFIHSHAVPLNIVLQLPLFATPSLKNKRTQNNSFSKQNKQSTRPFDIVLLKKKGLARFKIH